MTLIPRLALCMVNIPKGSVSYRCTNIPHTESVKSYNHKDIQIEKNSK